jgi:hypothetical protein
MNATKIIDLIDSISYTDGLIGNQEAIENAEAEIRAIGNDFEVVETGLVGWGEANAVIKHGGGYYLAVVR